MYIVLGGELKDLQGPLQFRDCKTVEFVGAYPTYDDAVRAWRARAQQTVDNALALTPKNDWDLAAADLIATEAGACVGDHLGRPFVYNRPVPVQRSLLCAAPGLCELILTNLSHIDPPAEMAL